MTLELGVLEISRPRGVLQRGLFSREPDHLLQFGGFSILLATVLTTRSFFSA
jgi:hypothetical protein